jgi:hypothetical protein
MSPVIARAAHVLSVVLVVACADSPLVTAPGRLEKIGDVARLEDLRPGDPGIFVYNTSPQICWWGSNPDVAANDADHDWVHDSCEGRLASAFAPRIMTSATEPCPTWEPVWATKGYAGGVRMRIAYMLAYWKDCGQKVYGVFTIPAHDGDSEMVTVQIIFDANSNHWMTESVWTSAHYLEDNFDNSEWKSWWEYQFVDNHSRGRPIVWASRSKHANYWHEAWCNFEESEGAECENNTWARDVPVLLGRNAGSRDVDLMGCVVSMDPGRAGNGRCENFHHAAPSPQRFNGWDPELAGEGGASAYRSILMGVPFERYEATNDWGPDINTPPPNFDPPPPPTFSVEIVGGSSIGPYVNCFWTAQVNNATPVAYSWQVNGGSVSGGDAQTLYYTNNGSDFTLSVEVTASTGERRTASMSVAIAEGVYCAP